LYFPVLFCLSVSVKWLAVKTASEMISIVSSGALNSTQTKPNFDKQTTSLRAVLTFSAGAVLHSFISPENGSKNRIVTGLNWT